MSTYTVIHIKGARRVTARRIENAIERAGLSEALNDFSCIEEEPGAWAISGNSKSTADAAHELASDVTRRFPPARAVVTEEWDARDADEAGSTTTVYIGGEHRIEYDRKNGMVPEDLDASVKAVRDALAGAGDLADAARWLVDGLDGIRADAEPEPEPRTVKKVKITDQWGNDYTGLFATAFDYSDVTERTFTELLTADSPRYDRRLTTREDVGGIIRAWMKHAAARTGTVYSCEWVDGWGAYVITYWDGTEPGFRRVDEDGTGDGHIPFDALVDALRLDFTVKWSDGTTEE